MPAMIHARPAHRAHVTLVAMSASVHEKLTTLRFTALTVCHPYVQSRIDSFARRGHSSNRSGARCLLTDATSRDRNLKFQEGRDNVDDAVFGVRGLSADASLRQVGQVTIPVLLAEARPGECACDGDGVTEICDGCGQVPQPCGAVIAAGR
jgi:hypothetical protein